MAISLSWQTQRCFHFLLPYENHVIQFLVLCKSHVIHNSFYILLQSLSIGDTICNVSWFIKVIQYLKLIFCILYRATRQVLGLLDNTGIILYASTYCPRLSTQKHGMCPLRSREIPLRCRCLCVTI